MQVGLVLPMADSDGPGADRLPQIRRLAEVAEAGGIDSLWLYDHLIFRGLEADLDTLRKQVDREGLREPDETP